MSDLWMALPILVLGWFCPLAIMGAAIAELHKRLKQVERDQ